METAPDLFSPPAPLNPNYPLGIPREVCDLFEQLAFEVRRAGLNHYSARAILHRMRWHMNIERGNREWKCNNNWTPTLSRWLMIKYPVAMENFFETRASPHDD